MGWDIEEWRKEKNPGGGDVRFEVWEVIGTTGLTSGLVVNMYSGNTREEVLNNYRMGTRGSSGAINFGMLYRKVIDQNTEVIFKAPGPAARP